MFASNSSASPASTDAGPNHLTDQAVESADHAIKVAQRVATDALDSLAGAIQALRAQAEPLLDGAADQASSMAHRGLNSLHDSSAVLRTSARQASESTVSYIRHDPIKSILMAAATGAALMGLIGLMRGPYRRD
ncbi:hypothetical protein [Sphaerotilus sp.]|uniref:hypothetical protein n=1 Tax=Sphaerotilus sp. TaxID=2093942 RepID=UPI0034E1DA06